MRSWSPTPLALLDDGRVLGCSARAQTLLFRLYAHANGDDFVRLASLRKGEPLGALWRRVWGAEGGDAAKELVDAGVLVACPEGLRFTIQTPPFPLADEHVRRLMRCSYVYAIGPIDGDTVKIGYSADPRQRLRDLQTGHQDVLAIYALMPGGEPEENATHQRFGASRIRPNNEWFRLDGPVISWCKEWGVRG